MDSFLFYSALFVHLISLITGFGAVIVIDMFGLLWMTGRVNLERVTSTAHITQRLIWLGWCGLILSGIPMILIKGYVDNLTMIKLFAVLMIGLNGIFLHFINQSLKRIGKVTPKIKFRIGLATVISQIGWWTALTIGFLHRHWEHEIAWPMRPWMFMLTAVVVVLIVYIIGEKVTAQNGSNR